MTPPGARERDTTPSPSTVRRSRVLDAGGSNSAGPTLHGEERKSGNLPLELSSFVGREREVAEVKHLLTEHPLLTLTGPGGSGKTRLAMAVAQDLMHSFEDGVWWVELAPISETELVVQAVAQALMIREEAGRPLVETLSRDLASTELLLVLDNCEHLIEECAALADTLLRACPNLRILATDQP